MGLPVLQDKDFVTCLSLFFAPMATMPVYHTEASKRTPDSMLEWLLLRVATYNAMTLKSWTGTDRILQQFSARGVHIVLFQEARRKFKDASKVFRRDGWTIAFSSAGCGSAERGCAIAVGCTRPVAKHKGK